MTAAKSDSFSTDSRFHLLFAPLMVLWITMVAVAAPAPAAERLKYRQKWLLNTSVVGDVYAQVHGFFADNDLEVAIKPGGPEHDAIRELELGTADFGVASADQVIRARSKGAPVVVIAQLFQINPLQWIYRASSPAIHSLQDLNGLTIGITYGGNDETIMRTLMAKGGLTERDVHLAGVRYDYTPFFKGKVDIWPVYRNAQGPIIADKLARAGETVRYFDPTDFGIRFVANSVVTTERTWKERPGTVKRFVKSLVRGWQAALDPGNRQKAIETIQRFDKDTPHHLIVQQLEATALLVAPRTEIPIGTIDSGAWKQTEQILRDQKQIPAPVHIENYLVAPL